MFQNGLEVKGETGGVSEEDDVIDLDVVNFRAAENLLDGFEVGRRRKGTLGTLTSSTETTEGTGVGRDILEK